MLKVFRGVSERALASAFVESGLRKHARSVVGIVCRLCQFGLRGVRRA